MDVAELISSLVQLFSTNTISSKFISVMLYIILVSITISTISDILIKIFGKDKMKSLVEIIKNSSFGNKIKHESFNPNDEIRKRVSLDITIENILQDAVKSTNINRALLFQFHNGQVAKSGMPFEWVVLTHESDCAGTAKSTLINIHNDLRLFYQLGMDLFSGKVVFKDVEDFQGPIKDFMLENGDTKICAKILTNPIDKKIVGMLIFTITTSENFQDNIESEIERTALVCSGVLTNSWGKCDFCKFWNRKCTHKEVSKKYRNARNDCKHFSPSAHQ